MPAAGGVTILHLTNSWGVHFDPLFSVAFFVFQIGTELAQGFQVWEALSRSLPPRQAAALLPVGNGVHWAAPRSTRAEFFEFLRDLRFFLQTI